MEITSINFKTGEKLPGLGDVFFTKSSKDPDAVMQISVVSILGVSWLLDREVAVEVGVVSGVTLHMVAEVSSMPKEEFDKMMEEQKKKMEQKVKPLTRKKKS